MLMHPRTRPQTSQKREKLMNRSLVSVASWFMFTSFHLATSERLKSTWRSSFYGFFKSKVLVQYKKSRKFHVFQCAAKKCKGHGSVHQYLDSKDCAANPTWRHMRSSVLVLMQSMQLQTTPSLMVVTELSSLPSLVLANTQLRYHIMLSLQRKIGKIIVLSTCFSS